MSRGFFGGSGTGAGGSGRPGEAKGRDLTKKQSTDRMLAYSRKRKKTMNELIQERSKVHVKSYQEMVEDLLDEKMTTPQKSRFSLPGTAEKEEKELTKGQKMAIEHFKTRRMKERMKTRDAKVDIVPKNYNGRAGGWIDKKGKIRNKDGLVVMEVNKETGVITNRMGGKVGKYNPHSSMNDFKIQRLIDKYYKDSKVFNPFGGKGGSHPFNPDKKI